MTESRDDAHPISVIAIRYEGGAERHWCHQDDGGSYEDWIAKVRADLASEPEGCSYEAHSVGIDPAGFKPVTISFGDYLLRRVQVVLEWEHSSGNLYCCGLARSEYLNHHTEQWTDEEAYLGEDAFGDFLAGKIAEAGGAPDLIAAHSLLESISDDPIIWTRHGGEVA